MTAPRLVLVDGRSGAGKTRFAESLAEQTGFQVLSLDLLYPGWDGLDAGATKAYREVMLPWSEGREVEIQEWDWRDMGYRGSHGVTASRGLIVEGCGALTVSSRALAAEAYWLEAPEQLRRQRALARDGESFRPHWQRWALQEDRLLEIHRSPSLASQIIQT